MKRRDENEIFNKIWFKIFLGYIESNLIIIEVNQDDPNVDKKVIREKINVNFPYSSKENILAKYGKEKNPMTPGISLEGKNIIKFLRILTFNWFDSFFINLNLYLENSYDF